MRYDYIVLLLLVLALGFFIGKGCARDNTMTMGTIETHDTITQYIASEPIKVTDVVTKVVRRTDTITRVDTIVEHVSDDGLYCSPAFLATVDTIADSDTIHASFRYPDATLSLLIRQAPSEIKTIYITRETIKRQPWFVDVLTHVGAASVGFAIARLEAR